MPTLIKQINQKSKFRRQKNINTIGNSTCLELQQNGQIKKDTKPSLQDNQTNKHETVLKNSKV